MKKFILIISFFVISLNMYAAPIPDRYQIDIIGFLHLNYTETENIREELNSSIPLIMLSKSYLPLKSQINNDSEIYQLMPPYESELQREYNILRSSNNYQILFQYSWIQPQNNKKTVKLPDEEIDGWLIKSVIRVNKSQYYLLDANFYFANLSDSNSSFLLNTNQRLKENNLYYIDHPKVGVLIKIYEIKSIATTELNKKKEIKS